MDWEQLKEASLLILMGMAVVFVALLTLMVAIMAMNRLAPEKSKKDEGGIPVIESIEEETINKEKIALIAVAMARAMEKETGRVPCVLAGTPSGEQSRWAASGREQIMRSRGKAGHQWGRRTS